MARIRSSHLRLTVVVALAALAATGCGSSSSSGTSSAASVSLHCAVVKKNLSWRCDGTSTNHEKFRWAKVTFDPKSGRMSTPPPTLVK